MWTILVYLGIFIISLYLLIRLYVNWNDDFWPNHGVPYLDLNTIAPFYKRVTMSISLADLEEKMYNKFGNIPYGGYMEVRTPTLFLKDPELIKKILVKDFDHFVDRRVMPINPNEPIMSRMLIDLGGKDWKDMRTIISPSFTTGKIRYMVHSINLSAKKMVDYMKQNNGGGEFKNEVIIDFQNASAKFTMDVIACTAFGVQSDTFTMSKSGGNSIFSDMGKKLTDITVFNVFKFLLFLLFPSVAIFFRLKFSEPTSLKFFTDIALNSIAERRREKNYYQNGGGGPKRNDFIQLLMEAQDNLHKNLEEEEDGGKIINRNILDDNTIVAQCLLFFFAGTDTLNSLLTFCAYSLALNPEIQDKLAQEVDGVMEDEEVGGVLTYEVIHGMEYLDKVVSETLRLYPPAAALERTCTEEYVVEGTKIVLPKGGMVNFSIMGLHHDPQYFPDPQKFNPEHFSVENKAKRHPYVYMPFGEGNRGCIAKRFALTEAKVAIAHLVHHFKIECCPKTPIPVKFNLTNFVLKPEKDMFLKFVVREH